MKFYTVDTKKVYDIYLTMWGGTWEGYGPDVINDLVGDMTYSGFVRYDVDYAWVGKQKDVDEFINWLEDKVVNANEGLSEDELEKKCKWFSIVNEKELNQETYEDIKDMLK